jgi:hypothetical protein
VLDSTTVVSIILPFLLERSRVAITRQPFQQVSLDHRSEVAIRRSVAADQAVTAHWLWQLVTAIWQLDAAIYIGGAYLVSPAAELQPPS